MSPLDLAEKILIDGLSESATALLEHYSKVYKGLILETSNLLGKCYEVHVLLSKIFSSDIWLCSVPTVCRPLQELNSKVFHGASTVAENTHELDNGHFLHDKIHAG